MLPKEIILSISDKKASFLNAALKGSQPDLFIAVGEHIFPIHRSRFTSSHYIINQIPEYEVVHIITQPINALMTSKVLSLFYGSQVIISKMAELDLLLDTLDFFQLEALKEEIERKIKKGFSDYEIFPLLELAYKYNLHQIFKLCMITLQKQEFEQINYNKFEFIQCDFILFQIVLRRHHRLKISEKIYGLTPDAIEQVIQLYCSTNKYDQDTLNKLKEKYVKSLVTHGLLKLDRILSKQMFQSGIYQNQNQKVTKMYKFETSIDTEVQKVKKNQRTRRRKYSCNVMDVKPGNWSKFKDSVQYQTKKDVDDLCIPEESESIKQKQSEKRQFENTAIFEPQLELQKSERNPFDEDKSNQNLTLYDLEREKQKFNQMLLNSRNISQEHFSGQEFNENTEMMMGKISGLIDQYYEACQLHEGTLRHKLAQSEENQEFLKSKQKELPKTGRFSHGFRLTNTLEFSNPMNRLIQQFDD